MNIYLDHLPHNLFTSNLLWTSGKFRCDCLFQTDTVFPFSSSATLWVMDGVSIRADFLGYISWYLGYASSCTELEVSIWGAECSFLSLVKGYLKESWFCFRLLLTALADYICLCPCQPNGWRWGSEVHLLYNKHNNILKGYILKENRPLWDQI